MHSSIKICFGIIAVTAVIFGFQNCGESLDLSQINSSSQVPTPKINILESSSLTVAEDGDGVLSVEVENLDEYTLSWEKDGVLVEGQTEANLILTNSKWYDAGVYVAIATDLDGNEVRSEDINLGFDPLIGDKTYNGGFINYQGINYRLIHNNNATVAQARALAYCKATRGPTATRVSHNFFASNIFVTIRYYSLATDAASCVAGVDNSVAYFHGLCLRDNGVNFNFFSPYQTIVCNVQ